MSYTPEEIKKAKYTDLYNYLIMNHEDDFTLEGDSLRMIENHSVSIKQRFTGYYDFGTGKGGDSISFLRDYYGYTFREAVGALLAMESNLDHKLAAHKNESKPIKKEIPFQLPKEGVPPLGGMELRVFYYLTMKRMLPADTVQMLLDEGLVYQSSFNIVFLNYKKDCYEMRGMFESGKPFRQVGFTEKDRFWYLGKKGTTVYVTEAAIDAISLYELRKREQAIYVSMHGVANQAIIDRIVTAQKYDVVLAVDNDAAGQECRDRNPGLPVLVPMHKDWNEDWIYKTNMNMTATNAEKEEEE